MSKLSPRDRNRPMIPMVEKLVYKHTSPTTKQPWVWLSLELIDSVAFKSMCGNCYKAFFRVLQEHMAQGRFKNGELVVTFDQFKKAGISHNMVGPTIKKLKTFGLIRISRGWLDGRPAANQFELTYLGHQDGSPAKNDWKKCTQEIVDKYLSDVKMERLEKEERRKSLDSHNGEFPTHTNTESVSNRRTA